MTSVTIPKSVTRIGNYAFASCSGLTSVTIPNSVMSIGICAFEKCSDLAEVTIGNGVKIIDTYAFYNCPELLDVYCYAEKLPNTEGDAFDVSYPEYATLHVPHRSIEDYKKVAPWSSFGTIKAISGTDQYFITYMLEGTEFHKDTLNVGATITPPQVSEKEGYTFDGWKNLPDTMPAKDIIVEGSYSENKYLLTFKIGDEVISTDSVAYGAKIEVPTAPEKEGHTFNGWADVPETMPAKHLTINGSYIVNTYMVTYIIDYQVYRTDTVEYDAKLTLPQAPEKEGYIFSGWMNVPEKMPAHNITVMGMFRLDSNNPQEKGFLVTSPSDFRNNVAYTVSAPNRHGYELSGNKSVGYEIPMGKRVKIGTAQKKMIPGKWYFLHNPRNPNHSAIDFDQDGVIQKAGGLVTDQGTDGILRLSATSVIEEVSDSNGVLADDFLASMVRFVAVDSVEGAFHIQFGTGNWLALIEDAGYKSLMTVTNDDHNAGLSGLYNFYLITVEGESNTAGRFGWNKYNMDGRVDNNGAGNNVNFWSEGEITAENKDSNIAEEGHEGIKGNNVWQIYDILTFEGDHDLISSERGHGEQISFVTPDNGKTYYMYHHRVNKFFNKKGDIVEEAVDPIHFDKGLYTWTLRPYFDDEHNININNEGDIVINDMKVADASNSFIFVANSTFDTEELDAKLGIPHNYKVTYIVDEEEYHVDTVLSGSKITPIEEPIKEGYTFSGWKNVPDTMPRQDIIIKGSFTINTYKVTYMVGEDVIATDYVVYGAKIEVPTAPEKEGYTFNGWLNVPETMPAKDVVVTGSYSVNKYLLSFKIGEEIVASDSIEYGAKIEVPTAPEKEGYTFNGWKDVPETMPAKDVIVTGSYNVNKYLLTFKIGDEVVASDSIEYGAKIEVPTAPEKEGYTFNGWKDVPESMPANDVVVNGSYSVNKYLLTFKIGEEIVASDSIEYGAKIEVPTAPEKEGYTFNGWKDVPETMPAKNVVATGSFSVNKYLLTFKIDDEMVASDSIEYGAKIEVPTAPEKEGYTFNGWKDVPESMPANDVVVTGSYTVHIYKVYYYVGDELVHTDEVAYGSEIPAYEYAPTNGDKFLGWEGEKHETMPAKDLTYKANIESGIFSIEGDISHLKVYDLNGRRIVNTKQLKSGVYVVNGKRVVLN